MISNLLYTITGIVKDLANSAISGAVISDGLGHTASTDVNGNYTLSGLVAGAYTITPSKSGYTFSPTSRNVTVAPNATGQNFTGTPVLPSKTWTLMYYLAGDQIGEGADLTQAHKTLLDRLMTFQGNPNFNIAVMFDGDQVGDSRYYAIGDNTTFIAKDEINTGSPQSLTAFVNWARTTFPSTYSALIIADHGNLSGSSQDYHPDTLLSTKDLGTALSQVAAQQGKVDVLFMGVCLNGTIDVAYQVKDSVNYLVASQNLLYVDFERTEPTYLSSIVSSTTPESLAYTMADTYARHYKNGSNSPYTISAARLSRLPDLVAKTSALAGLLKNQMPQIGNTIIRLQILTQVQRFDADSPPGLDMSDELIDLYDFARLVKAYVGDQGVKDAAQEVMNAISADTTSANRYIFYNSARSGTAYTKVSYNLEQSYGVSVFFPYNFRSFYTGTNFDFASGTSWARTPARAQASTQTTIEWGPMLVEYVKATNPTAPDDPNPPPLVAPLDPTKIPVGSQWIYLPFIQR